MITFREALGLIVPYVRAKIVEQVKSVALIILYLLFFQTLVLGIPIAEASIIAIGLSLVILGLTFFMEGLLLGLMPLGEAIGIKLPQKSTLLIIIGFAFILGMGATFAEPAIGVLKVAGSSVRAWEAPLLFLLLNTHAALLVYAVGIGVGLAVVFGTLRFLYVWSLKPFLYILVTLLCILTVWGHLNPNLRFLTGLAWDCGGVTTGPVTVPLVLALGIGINRVAGGDDAESGGFGVVTLASLFPILAVFFLGVVYLGQVPPVMSEAQFFSRQHRQQAMRLFASESAYFGYAFRHASRQSQLALFDGDEEKMLATLQAWKADARLQQSVFGAEPKAFERWAIEHGSATQQIAIFGSMAAVREASERLLQVPVTSVNVRRLLGVNVVAATQAILPLSLFLLLVLFLVLREKLPNADEVFLGLALALIGMIVFNIGIEIGLSKMGNQVGSTLPASYRRIELAAEKRAIPQFRRDLVQQAIAADGSVQEFFFTRNQDHFVAVRFQEKNLDPATGRYYYTPTRGPLFGIEGAMTGIMVVLLFAFFMGYGATLAEPALNALGATVESITVGTFKKTLLMQSVALGVGLGTALGVGKIIWDIPLVWMLVPLYIVLLFVTWISTEEFVNIGWDSAGVTTGPITVPLVLAMGLGIGTQSGVVEGFGILAMASVCPILSVLLVGLWVTARRQAVLAEVDVQAT